MLEPTLVPDLLSRAAERWPERPALTSGERTLGYLELQTCVIGCAAGLLSLGLLRGDRVAVYLDNSIEAVVACFGGAAAGCVFVPLNPLLKSEQVAHVLKDCNARLLVTSPGRLATLSGVLNDCPDLRHLVVTAAGQGMAALANITVSTWSCLLDAPARTVHRVIDADMAAILYTSGSTGRPKGVILSHRNLVAGAASVVTYLGNHAEDSLLAVLPLSFDAGFSQLTTAFYAGARAVLLNYLLPRDVLKTIAREHITGLTAVPPLFIQLAQLEWPSGLGASLRYYANTGGRLPRQTLTLLRQRLPQAQPFLMYGLTEAFRSTYLPPEQVDRRPDSIGKAIPNAEILVLREDGTPCAPDEPGELVHRGSLVGLGYWNDPTKTAERYRPLPGREPGLVLPEMAVFSGDTVRMDAEGYLYFIGRRDEMIKTSGYRVSPTEVEEVLYATGQVGECAVFGVEHASLGQAIQVVATPPAAQAAPPDRAALLAACRDHLPAYMLPAGIEFVTGPLPRNPNGKIDRKLLATRWGERHGSV